MYSESGETGYPLAAPHAYCLDSLELETATETVHLFAASAIGTTHRVADLPRQDAYRFQVVGERLNIVISDGVSAAAMAEIGAHIAVDAGIQALTEMNELDPVSLVHQVNRWLILEAYWRSIDPLELSCTFTVLSVNWMHGDGFFVSVGDSAVFSLDPIEGEDRHKWMNFFDPHRSEALNGQLPFVGTEEQISQLLDRYMMAGPVNWPPERSIFLMTDGVSRDLGREPEGSETFAEQWSVVPNDIKEFLDQILYERAYSYDDRTVVGLWRTPREEMTDDGSA